MAEATIVHPAVVSNEEWLVERKKLLMHEQEDFEDSPPGWPQRPTYG